MNMNESGLHRGITITVSSKTMRAGKTHVCGLIKQVLEQNGYNISEDNVGGEFDVLVKEITPSYQVNASNYESIILTNTGHSWRAVGIRKDNHGVHMVAMTPIVVYSILVNLEMKKCECSEEVIYED